MKNKEWICRYCHEDDRIYVEKSREVIKNNGFEITAEYCNPGGREIHLGLHRIQLFDTCRKDDYEIIVQEIEKLKKEIEGIK